MALRDRRVTDLCREDDNLGPVGCTVPAFFDGLAQQTLPMGFAVDTPGTTSDERLLA